MKVTSALLGFVCFAVIGTGVAARQAAPRGGGAPVVSPEVSADGKVTFRLRAAGATEVAVIGLSSPLSMTRDDQGVWSATTPSALAPDIYQYGFTVDGARVADPGNVTHPLVGTPSRAATSTLVIPGAPWTSVDVPHGAVAKHVYKSRIIEADQTYFVYTPPGYEARRTKPYPIVVMLHGLGDMAPDWIANGGANLTLDGLIAQGKAVPMILVTPSSYGNSSGTRGAAAGFPNFTRALLEEMLPQVEREYNASTSAADHAISGLSMGGAQSLLLLNNLDQFAWFGSFSPGFDMYARINTSVAAPNAGPGAGRGAPGGQTPVAGAGGRGNAGGGASGGVRMRAVLEDGVLSQLFPSLDAKANSRIKMLYLSCGTEDDHLMLMRQFQGFIESRGLKVTNYIEAPDFAHVWPFWRIQFVAFAQKLFR